MTDDFQPILRFLAMSDVHYKDEHTKERDRMAQALADGRGIAAAHPSYNALDAVAVVGDFANSGSETQMRAFKKTLDEGLEAATQTILSIASHEFGSGGVEAAEEKLQRIFGQAPDVHRVINGFHFISVSPSKGTDFDDKKRAWAGECLKIAAADDPKKPIFFFQHPHVTDTVSGSINWGNDDFTALLMHYPQVIDFSGHSHAPINDPRSIHQRHFTALGCGTLAYFELDEFDKYYGTVPPRDEEAAQMLVVETDAQNRVRIVPYNILTHKAFPYVWRIDEPSNPDSFQYTNAKRQAADTAPYFLPTAFARAEDITSTSANIVFAQAVCDTYDVNDYVIRVRRAEDNAVVRQIAIWSEYYFDPKPETLSVPVSDLQPGTAYKIEIRARGFFDKTCKTPLTASFETVC
ncbi:MAG: hypothetical protein LBB67_00600 [Oscillospiraceae bacterium]|jgi:hypothetical protein|nr:hypothetical protein [Oscillospiraceae bacterium]